MSAFSLLAASAQEHAVCVQDPAAADRCCRDGSPGVVRGLCTTSFNVLTRAFAWSAWFD